MDEFSDESFEEWKQRLFELAVVDLVSLRGSRATQGSTSSSDFFGRAPFLLEALGAGDEVDAYNSLKQLAEVASYNDRYAAAAAAALDRSPGQTLDDQMKASAQALAVTERTIWTYTEKGLEKIAHKVVQEIISREPVGAPLHHLSVRGHRSGHLLVELIAQPAVNGEVNRPYWIMVGEKRIAFGDADVLDETPRASALRWRIPIKLPKTNSVAPGGVALQIAILLRSASPSKIRFSDQWPNPHYRLEFTAARKTAHIVVLRREASGGNST